MWLQEDPWQRIEDVRKHPIRSFAVMTFGTAVSVVVAVVASMQGAPSAPVWWLFAGLVLFGDVMALLSVVMTRRQRRRAAKSK